MVHHLKHHKNFTQIDNGILDPREGERRLGPDATVILCYLLSKPDDWIPRPADIMKRFDIGSDRYQNAMKELEECGYARKKAVRKSNGRVSGSEWEVAEHPSFLENHRGAEKPRVGKTEGREISPYSNTDKNSKTRKENNTRGREMEASPLNGNGTSKNHQSIFIKRASLELIKFIESTSKIIVSPTDRKKHESQISKLLQSLDGDKARLKRVLTSYIKTEHTQFTPRVSRPFHFTDKFTDIERWLNRDNPPPKEEYQVEVTRTRRFE